MAPPQPADVRSADVRSADVRSTPEQSVPLDWDAVRAYLAEHGLRLDSDPPPRQFAGGWPT